MKTYIMYEITCNDVNVEYTYVGHTTNFRNRKNSHKTRCYNENDKKYNLKIYKFIRENGNFDNWSMNPLEEYECETIMQERIREQYWLDIKQSKLNSLRAYSTSEQRKEAGKQYDTQYRIDNKERISERDKQYSIINKEKKKQYRIENKEHFKQYYVNNKEHIAETGKQYRIDNNEAIQERKKQIIVCECGVNTTHQHKLRHMRTAKHLELMSKLNL
jgi:hypothetical protein